MFLCELNVTAVFCTEFVYAENVTSDCVLFSVNDISLNEIIERQ